MFENGICLENLEPTGTRNFLEALNDLNGSGFQVTNRTKENITSTNVMGTCSLVGWGNTRFTERPRNDKGHIAFRELDFESTETHRAHKMQDDGQDVWQYALTVKDNIFVSLDGLPIEFKRQVRTFSVNEKVISEIQKIENDPEVERDEISLASPEPKGQTWRLKPSKFGTVKAKPEHVVQPNRHRKDDWKSCERAWLADGEHVVNEKPGVITEGNTFAERYHLDTEAGNAYHQTMRWEKRNDRIVKYQERIEVTKDNYRLFPELASLNL